LIKPSVVYIKKPADAGLSLGAWMGVKLAIIFYIS
jgi:hypothetical protein